MLRALGPLVFVVLNIGVCFYRAEMESTYANNLNKLASKLLKAVHSSVG